jgi:hypothetical protein
MITTRPTEQHTRPDASHDPTSTSRKTTATKRYSRKPSDEPNGATRATRSKDSHRCIVIHRCGPASGQPTGNPPGADLRVDHVVIFSGRSQC